jgi:RimJ/RimL family protein N-acetyltransferase
MQELTIWDERALLHLFTGLEEHLAVEAMIRGAAAGRVWVDEPAAPHSAAIWVQHRVFVMAEDVADRVVAGLNRVVQEVAEAAQARGDWGMGVYGPQKVEWEPVLRGLDWRRSEREYWEATREEWQQSGAAEQVDGLALCAVDRELVEQAQLGRMEQLREEMCSERPSVEDFLARSFGMCLVDEKQGTLAGWCLSEYNCDDRCEVGIEVVEAYQRRGLGTLLAQALCQEAFAQRGIRRVGWHCLAANAASGATARRSGLRLVNRYGGAVVLLRG